MKSHDCDLPVATAAARELLSALIVLEGQPPRDEIAPGHARASSLSVREWRELLLDARRSARLAESALRPRRSLLVVRSEG